MTFIRTRSRCNECPLRDRRKIQGFGSFDSKVAVCGESPGSEETSVGKPFVGPAGRILDAGLAAGKLLRERVYALNLINCQPPKNDLGSFEGEQALACCKPGFDDEISWLMDHGIRVIIAAGNHPAAAFGIEGGITKKRGSVYEITRGERSAFVIPTFHPSFINRMRWGKADARKDLEWTWISDIAKAKTIARDGWNPPEERFELNPSRERVEEVLSRRGELVSVDIETTGLNPVSGRVVVIGFGFSESEAVVTPFLKQGGGSYWRPLEEVDIIHELNTFFASNRLVFHNALFDVRFLQGAGFTIPWSSVAHDTMLLHHVVAPEMPHGLDFVVSMYGATPYWKEDFRKREGKILELDDKVLRTYNARDCVVLHQILGPLLADAESLSVLGVYREESLALLPVIASMMDTGIRVDKKRLSEWRRHLEGEYHVLERTLRSAGLPSAFNLSSDEDLRWFLYGVAPAKFKRLDALDKKRAGTKIHTELTALATIRDSTKPIYLLRGHKGRRTDTGKVAVNKAGLLSLTLGLNNRLAEVERLKVPRPDETDSIKRLLEWLTTFDEWSGIEKLISTYTEYPIADDGHLHSQFLIHGTATGRLSSRDPNLMNQPIKDQPLLGRCFVASEGSWLLQADYSNLEVRVLAYETGDEALIDAVEHRNVHDENTKHLFGISNDDPLWKAARDAAKVFQFGSLSYGGGDHEVHQQILLKAPGLNLTFSRFVEAKARWMASHPAYAAWKARVSEEALKTRRVTNAFGRVRILGGPQRDIVKEALNFPIQSAAASTINRAMVRIAANVSPGRLLIQVHDSLLFDVPEASIPATVQLVKVEMERPVDFRGKMVSFPIEVETGPNWGQMTKYADS